MALWYIIPIFSTLLMLSIPEIVKKYSLVGGGWLTSATTAGEPNNSVRFSSTKLQNCMDVVARTQVVLVIGCSTSDLDT